MILRVSLLQKQIEYRGVLFHLYKHNSSAHGAVNDYLQMKNGMRWPSQQVVSKTV